MTEWDSWSGNVFSVVHFQEVWLRRVSSTFQDWLRLRVDSSSGDCGGQPKVWASQVRGHFVQNGLWKQPVQQLIHEIKNRNLEGLGLAASQVVKGVIYSLYLSHIGKGGSLQEAISWNTVGGFLHSSVHTFISALRTS